MEITWEDISKKISDAADYTVKKTEKLTAMAKLEYKLANTKSKLNLLYQNLGKVKFSEMAGDSIDEVAYQEMFDKIAGLLITIEHMEEELAHLRNYRFCVACNAKIGNDMAFCPKCGTRQQPADDGDVTEVTELSTDVVEAKEEAKTED